MNDEIDAEMYDEIDEEEYEGTEDVLVCPYCGKEQTTHESDDISADLCPEVCEQCGKRFWYSVTVTRTYWSSKDDDLNADGNKANILNIIFGA